MNFQLHMGRGLNGLTQKMVFISPFNELVMIYL